MQPILTFDFKINGVYQDTIEMPPLKPDPIYEDDVKSFSMGYIDVGVRRLGYFLGISTHKQIALEMGILKVEEQ